MMMVNRSTVSSPRPSWEPEPLELPLELPHLPPESERGEPSGSDDEPPVGGSVIVLDIA